MKVLRVGVKEPHWQRERLCSYSGGCGAKLLVDESDLTPDPTCEGNELSSNRCVWVCPECGRTNSSNVPFMVRDRVRKLAEKK